MSRSQAKPLENLPGRRNLYGPYDFLIVTVSLFLVMAGLVMVASSSISISESRMTRNAPWPFSV